MPVKTNVKPLRLSPVAAAIAAKIKSAISAAPGNRWERTGELLASIRAVEAASGSAAVAHAPDRLQNNNVRQKFADECLPDPRTDTRVRNAIAKVVHDAITVAVIKK